MCTCTSFHLLQNWSTAALNFMFIHVYRIPSNRTRFLIEPTVVLSKFPIIPAAKRAFLEIKPGDCNRINTVHHFLCMWAKNYRLKNYISTWQWIVTSISASKWQLLWYIIRQWKKGQVRTEDIPYGLPQRQVLYYCR